MRLIVIPFVHSKPVSRSYAAFAECTGTIFSGSNRHTNTNLKNCRSRCYLADRLAVSFLTDLLGADSLCLLLSLKTRRRRWITLSDDELRAFRGTLAPARRLCQAPVVRYSALATSTATT